MGKESIISRLKDGWTAVEKAVVDQVIPRSQGSPQGGGSPRLMHTRHFCLGLNDSLEDVSKTHFPCR